ncbi:MAG: T9SS type A sorting domain-containing protein [Flavobacteriales bacterium]|nr:T9SS type A sorting domain-containing protein [Flavobacteriales bacterium]
MRQQYVLRSFFSLFLIALLASASMAQGDTCTTALQVVSGVYNADGPMTGYAGPSCGSGTNGDWYRYTATFTGTIKITSCHPLNNGLSFDTYLKVFSGNCDALVCIGNNDDMGQAGQGCPNNAFASYLQVNVTAGQDYFIVWTNTFSSIPFYWELSECAGTATGATYFDNNNNGTREPGEAHVPVVMLVQPGDHYVYSGSDPYSLCTDMGTHTITVPTPPLYHTTVPASQSFTIAALGDQITGMDFGFQGIPGIYDGAVNLWGWNPWIGNNTTLHIGYSNIGTEDITPTIALTLDPVLSYVSATTTATSVNGQTIIWALPVMSPGTSGSITVTVYTDPATTPNQSVLDYVVLTTAETDINMVNNTDDVHGHASTSFDPNDKAVSEEFITPQDVVDQKQLEYTVRFQNTGNAPAVNIVIKDSLDADWDLSTFEMVGATHPYTLTINNEVAIWTFANIMLPTEDSDGMGSQGSFQYRVAPKSSLNLGEQLTNRADIYFDYNEPVLTNTTVTTVALSTALAENALRNGLFIAPSPSNGMINIRWADARLNIARFNVIDAMGRVVFTTNLTGVNNTRSMDLSFLSEGSYVARLIGDRAEGWTRFVIHR